MQERLKIVDFRLAGSPRVQTTTALVMALVERAHEEPT